MSMTKTYVVETGPHGLTWPDRHILIEPGTFNISIPRHTIDGGKPSYMLGASSDILRVLKKVNRAYVSDTGAFYPTLPPNPTGKRIAFVHEPMDYAQESIKVRVVTGRYWDVLIEEMWFKHYKAIEVTNSHSREQIRITRRSDNNPAMGESEIRIVAVSTEANVLFTGRDDTSILHLNNKNDVVLQTGDSLTGYDNFVEYNTYQQMLIGRRALTLNSMLYCKHTDGDNTTRNGSALYSYTVETDTLVKIYESEAMDVNWALESMLDAPANSAEFDAIVMQSHDHPMPSRMAMGELSINEATGNLVANNVELSNGIEALSINW
jgi:hypothetical protein